MFGFGLTLNVIRVFICFGWPFVFLIHNDYLLVFLWWVFWCRLLCSELPGSVHVYALRLIALKIFMFFVYSANEMVFGRASSRMILGSFETIIGFGEKCFVDVITGNRCPLANTD